MSARGKLVAFPCEFGSISLEGVMLREGGNDGAEHRTADQTPNPNRCSLLDLYVILWQARKNRSILVPACFADLGIDVRLSSATRA